MGSLDFAPPYPCCGNLTYHDGGARCEEYKAGCAPRPLPVQVATPFRYVWRTVPHERQ